MNSPTKQPVTDLERIQQTYTSGGQVYVPTKEKVSTTGNQQESGRGLVCNLSPQH